MKVLVTRMEGFSITRLLILCCTDTDTMKTALDLKQALKRACNKWAKTPEGLNAYDDSYHDFNFGDFLNYLDGPLAQFILDEGVLGFNVVDDILNNELSYDTVLMDEQNLECLECRNHIGNLHEPNCGKKGGAGHVMAEDCLETDQ
jgi:hypothetical protein